MKLYDILFEQSKPTWMSFIFENKLSDIRLKLSGKNLELFDQVLELKPQLPMKYWQWVAKKYATGSSYNPNEVHDLLLSFDQILTKKNGLGLLSKDINQYQSIIKLADAVEVAKNTVSSTQAREDIKSNSKTIYVDSRYVVLQPTSTASACYYGAGTKWCISAKEENQFENYTDEGIKFVMIIDKQAVKENPLAKVAIAFFGDPNKNIGDYLLDQYEIYDSLDHWRTIEDIWKAYPKPLLQKINQFFVGNVISSSPEEEKERIQALKSAKSNDILYRFLETLDVKLTDKETNQTKAIDYLRYSIEKLINNASDLQLGEMIRNYFDEHFIDSNPFSNQTLKYISDLLKAKVEEKTNGMNIMQKINYLTQILKIPAWLLSKYNFVSISNLPTESILDILQNSSDYHFVHFIISSNAMLFGRALTGSNEYNAYIIGERFYNIKEVFQEITNEYPGIDFFNLPSTVQYIFEKTIARNVSIEPRFYDYEGPAEKIFDMIKNKELKKIQTKRNGSIVAYLPKS